MRNNLNICSLQGLSLSVASSCDLQYFVDIIRERNLFEEVIYNFESGTSDDAFLEIHRDNNILQDSDVVVVSIAETVKKLLHPLIQKRDGIDYEGGFANVESKLRFLVKKLVDDGHKYIFIFSYPIDHNAFDINDRPWIYGSITYWIERLRRLYIDVLQEYGNRVDLIDLNEVLELTGMHDNYFRPELTGGHPEVDGAKVLVDLFLERLVSRVDLTNKVKAIALDLDNTLWKGVLLEQDTPPRIDSQRALALYHHTSKGIPICVVSKNNPEDEDKIKNIIKDSMPGLFRNILFFYIGWNAKSSYISAMAKDLGIGIDSIAFFDDSSYERGEVIHNLPGVRVYTEDEILKSLRYSEFSFLNLSDDAKRRIESYKTNAKRSNFESSALSVMDLKEYLKSLEFGINFSLAGLKDLDRVEELVQRTNQQNILLNRTPSSILIDYIEKGRAIIISLSDKFGDYGSIGVVLYDVRDRGIELQEMAISCRALGKGVEESIIAFLNNFFLGYDVVRFSYKLNYKNKSFFCKLLENNFSVDEDESIMTLNIDRPIDYPSWFSVDLSGLSAD